MRRRAAPIPSRRRNLARLRALLPKPTPQAILAVRPAKLRACGLSAAKVASLRALARAELPGIGDWSARRVLERVR